MKHLRLLFILALAAFAFGKTFIVPKEDARRISVLFFGAPTANSASHDPITRYRVLKKHLGVHGIDLTYTEDPAVAFNKETLALHDGLLMYGNWAQNGKMPEEQEKALLDFVEGGGGFLPIHCASACYGGSPKFVKLVGAKFKSHGAGVFAPKNTEVKHPVTDGYQSIEAWDETYVHSDHNDDRIVLQTREGEPWTWVREHGNGKIFYTASGHDHRVWDTPGFHDLMRRGILWSVGQEARDRLENFELPELMFGEAQLPGYLKRKTIEKYQLPLPPEESLKLAQVPPGFELALFASDPDIVNPISIDWDDFGRAYVIETIDYPNNLQANNLGNDRITICQDTDGDGAADKFTRFAEKLSIPTSLLFSHRGVICTNGSELIYLRDTDGDDQADVRKTIFKGFNMGDTHAGVSNLRHGPDNWIYATVGYSGFNGRVGNEDHQFSTGLFRFKIDKSLTGAEPGEDGTMQHLVKLEFVQNTTNNTWGLGFTRNLDTFTSTANGNPSLYLTFPRSSYDRVGLEQPRMPRADSKPLFFPASTDIRQVENHDGYTSAAGHAFYDAHRFPNFYLKNDIAFVCAPTGKLVGQFHVTANGSGFNSKQLPNNIYNSADAWSGPVAAEVGPDGALWICDWYNIIIQHNPTPSEQSAGFNAKRGKGNAYVTPLRDKEHGRIYRIYPKGTLNESTVIPFDANSGWNLAGFLTNKVSRHIGEKHRLAFVDDRNFGSMKNASDEQRKAVFENDLTLMKSDLKSDSLSSLWSFQTLHAMGRLDLESITASLRSKNPALRRLALRVAPLDDTLEKLFIKGGNITEEDPRTLMELLLALAKVAPTETVARAVIGLEMDSSDIGLNDARKVVLRAQASEVLPIQAKTILEKVNTDPGSKNLLSGLAGFKPRFYGGDRNKVTFTRSPDQGRNKAPCLIIGATEPVDCGWGVDLKVKPNTRYEFGGLVRTENLTVQRGPGVLFNIHGGPRSKTIKGEQDWIELKGGVTTGPRQTSLLFHGLLGAYGRASGKASYCDLFVRELGPEKQVDDPQALARWFVSSASVDGVSQVVNKLKEIETPLAKSLIKTLSETPRREEISRKFAINTGIHQRGAEVYSKTCIACHGPDGKGVEGVFPPLLGSDWITDDKSLPIRVVLHGLMGPVEVGGKKFNSAMPPLGGTLNDQEIADVITYVRQSWTNDASPVSDKEVAKVRKETAGREKMYTAVELHR
ncbi:ThuA domain-containing protein [bacterium]|nr:ThuA domain-containing protein [bacterium]